MQSATSTEMSISEAGPTLSAETLPKMPTTVLCDAQGLLLRTLIHKTRRKSQEKTIITVTSPDRWRSAQRPGS